MPSLLRQLIPRPVLGAYHRVLAVLANVWYGRPSERMIVIGVTGTTGKSSVIELLAVIFKAAGMRVGIASSIRFQAGERSWMNATKLTMVGRFQLQRWLRRMVDAGCQYAIIETTSLGIAQYRHAGIHYDTVLLTNLYREHLDAHGGYATYRRAKRRLFTHLARSRPKVIAGQTIPRRAIINLDSEYAVEFAGIAVEEQIGFTVAHRVAAGGGRTVSGEILRDGRRVGLRVNRSEIWLNLPGEHNAVNALAAYCVARTHRLAAADIQRALAQVAGIPGRIETIDAGQPFTMIVDYAFEPGAMEQLYRVAGTLPHGRVIQVLGTTGGGRDAARGAVLGAMAARFADIVIATDEDPYDDDPAVLVERVVRGATEAGKIPGKNLFVQLDRRLAIRQAVALAQGNDVVLITGKGSEQVMALAGGRKISWDDRSIAREEIRRKLLVPG